MGHELQTALNDVEAAAQEIFDADPAVRSVGVAQNGVAYGYVAVRNVAAPLAFGAKIGGPAIPQTFRGLSIHYRNSAANPRSLARVPHAGPASPGVGSLVLEQQLHRLLVCGLQIQNYDDDVRTGEINSGYIIIGTLGCFVELPGQVKAIVSNNHVVAGENRGINAHDRILQSGSASFAASMHVATLSDHVQLIVSPPGASIAAGNVTYNEIDAGVASLVSGQAYVQDYLPGRQAIPPSGTAVAAIGDKVHKVGRTTGLTFGEVTQVGVVVGPVGYGIGGCWFRQSIVIEGLSGTSFSDHGDSGSAIVRDVDGMVLGLLYAGNGAQTYACPIGSVLNQLNCRLA